MTQEMFDFQMGKANARYDTIIAGITPDQVEAAFIVLKYHAESRGVIILMHDCDGKVNGLSLRRNGQPIIILDSKADSRLKLRTLAHEIGHFYSPGGELVPLDTDDKRQREYDAHILGLGILNYAIGSILPAQQADISSLIA